MPDPEPLNNEQLNILYGDAGRTFGTREAAEAYIEKHKLKAHITPLWNHVGGKYGKCLAKARAGFLVTIDPPEPPKPRFTGKPRTHI